MLDMIDEKTSVKQKNTTDNTQNTSNNLFDENGGVLATLDTLSASVVEWRELQGKADDKLYSVLDGCLRVMYLCEDEDLKATLLSVCRDRGMKGIDNKGMHLIVSKLVFGGGDKKCYTYAKALENAKTLQLQSEENQQLLSDYLKKNGGIDALIRKSSVSVSKGYTDDKFGTEEHFGEEIIAHTLSSDALSADNPLGMKMKQRLEVEVVDETLHSIFTHSDAFVQYAKLKYDYTTRTMQIMPFTVAERDDAYASIDKIFNNVVGKTIKHKSQKVWNNYIKLCDKRDKRIKADKAKKDKEMIKELSKLAPL
jgi:hypothetical protein